MVFVDSNVILDVITADPRWQAWSEEQLCGWLNRGPVLINAIVYAEIAFATDTIEAVEELLPAISTPTAPFPGRPPSSPPRPTPPSGHGAAPAKPCWRIS